MLRAHSSLEVRGYVRVYLVTVRVGLGLLFVVAIHGLCIYAGYSWIAPNLHALCAQPRDNDDGLSTAFNDFL